MTHRAPRGDSEGPSFRHVALTSSQRTRLLRLAYLLTGSQEEAEDVVQDVLVRILSADNTRVVDLEAYARRAVTNECASWGRRLKRRRRDEEALRAEAHRLHGTSPDPFQRAEVASALLGLPSRHRDAIVLRYYLGWTDGEIAQSLGCAPATVRSWLKRGLARLKTQLEDPGASA